jgi:hypothetical protein
MLDVLGIQDELRRVDGPFWREGDVKRAAELMRAPVQKIHATRLNIAKMCESLNVIQQDVPDNSGVVLHTYAFADTVVIYHALGGRGGTDGPLMRGVRYGLVILSLHMLDSLANGIPLRGAVEVGLGLELTGSELAGRVMQSCHELESKLARTIRIVVGPGLLQMLEQGLALPQTESKHYLAERTLSAEVRPFIRRDPVDGLYVLDYLGVAASIAGAQPGFKETLSRALDFLVQQEEYWTRAMRLDRAEKYRAAIVYFRSVAEASGAMSNTPKSPST